MRKLVNWFMRLWRAPIEPGAVTPDYMPNSVGYGRCGANGRVRDHSQEELERYRKGINFLMKRRAEAIPVEEYPASIAKIDHPDETSNEPRPWSIQVF